VFFYAGHGPQVAGRNYLVPIDAELTTPKALEFEMVQLDVVHRIMERLTNTNIINNPLARNLARAMGTRSAERSAPATALYSGQRAPGHPQFRPVPVATMSSVEHATAAPPEAS
jgi:uncharacterized caspase-like protein